MKEELEAFYGNEANFAIREMADEAAQFPDGTAWAFCTNWANYVRRIEGDRAELYGFHEEDNPTAGVCRIADGHDFALVDGRYIVDGWASHVEGESRTAVLDLEDEADAAFVASFLGPRELWSRCDDRERMLDGESSEARAKAMEGIAERVSTLAPAI